MVGPHYLVLFLWLLPQCKLVLPIKASLRLVSSTGTLGRASIGITRDLSLDCQTLGANGAYRSTTTTPTGNNTIACWTIGECLVLLLNKCIETCRGLPVAFVTNELGLLS